MDPGTNNFRWIEDLKDAFNQWKIAGKSTQAAPETEVNNIRPKFQELKKTQVRRLEEMKKKEKDDIQSLKARLRRLQSDEPNSSIIEETDLWMEFKRSRGDAVRQINQKKENAGNDTVSLCEEDSKLLRCIIESSYNFVETKLNAQSRDIKKILNLQKRQDDMQKTKDDKVLHEERKQLQKVLSYRTAQAVVEDDMQKTKDDKDLHEEIKQLQKVLSYRTAQDIVESFIKDEWKTSICEKCTECEYLENEYEKNLSGLKKYTKACVKLSFSMCTDIPKREFDWDISIKHFTKPNSVQLNSTELSDKRLRLVWPAVVYKDENDKHILVEKGCCQLVSDNGTGKDTNKRDICGDSAQSDKDIKPSPTCDGNSRDDTNIHQEGNAIDSGGIVVDGPNGGTAGANRNDDQVKEGQPKRTNSKKATSSAGSRKHNKSENPKIHTKGQNNNPYADNSKKNRSKEA